MPARNQDRYSVARRHRLSRRTKTQTKFRIRFTESPISQARNACGAYFSAYPITSTGCVIVPTAMRGRPVGNRFICIEPEGRIRCIMPPEKWRVSAGGAWTLRRSTPLPSFSLGGSAAVRAFIKPNEAGNWLNPLALAVRRRKPHVVFCGNQMPRTDHGRQ